jgi:hypothetical protein
LPGDAANFVDVRLVHPLEKLARISRQRLDVSALALGVNRIESQRNLPEPLTPVTTVIY